MSQRSHIASSGRTAICECSAACSVPRSSVRAPVPQRLRGEGRLRQVQRDQVDRLVVLQALALVGQHLLGHDDGPEAQLHAERVALGEHLLDHGLGLALGLRVPVARRTGRRTRARPPARTPRPRKSARRAGRSRPGGRSTAPGPASTVPITSPVLVVDDRHVVEARGAQRHRARRVLVGVARDERAVRALAQLARCPRAVGGGAPRAGRGRDRRRPPAAPRAPRTAGGRRRAARSTGSRIAASTGRSRNSSGWRQKN